MVAGQAHEDPNVRDKKSKTPLHEVRPCDSLKATHIFVLFNEFWLEGRVSASVSMSQRKGFKQVISFSHIHPPPVLSRLIVSLIRSVSQSEDTNMETKHCCHHVKF
jgi:hypothetical protein